MIYRTLRSFILIKGQMEILLPQSALLSRLLLSFPLQQLRQCVWVFPDRSNLYLDFPKAKNDLQDSFDV